MGICEDTPDEKLTFAQLEQLEQSADPVDVARVKRVHEEWSLAMAHIVKAHQDRLFGRIKLPKTLPDKTVFFDYALGKLGKNLIDGGMLSKALVPGTLGKAIAGNLLDSVNMPSLMDDSKFASVVASMSKLDGLTEGLVAKSAFADVVGASGIGKLADVTAMASESFAIPKQPWQEQFSESMRREQYALNESLAEVTRISREREGHKYEAEQAAIATRRLLDALVDLAHAQQAQQLTQAAMLSKMAEEMAELTEHAKTAAAEDDKRWRKSWRAQKAELSAAMLAAILAGVAVWAAFAAAKPAVVNVPAPIVRVEAPTTADPPVELPPAEVPSAEQPPAERRRPAVRAGREDLVGG